MDISRRLLLALRSAAGAFQRRWTDPSGRQEKFQTWRDWYDYLWALHENTVYDDFNLASAYRLRYRLYRNTRGLYNPARRVADFYAGFVYPGPLAALEPGSAMPIETENDLILPAAQSLLRWSNWQENKGVFVRRGAALGDTVAVLVDDLERGKVYIDVLWPGHITDLDLDVQGNVKAYTLEYAVQEENGREFQYKRTVDQEAFRTYRNGQPFDYDGNGAEWANPYGFVPAVWARHRNVGGDHGEPAIAGVYAKLDELNGLGAALNDRIRAIVKSPLLVAGEGSARRALNPAPSTEPETEPDANVEDIRVLKMPTGTTVSMLELHLADAYPAMDRLLVEIEQDLPELTWQREMRKMSEVTGPGARRLIQDVESRLGDAQATYDLQTTKLIQMGVAMAGWRANSGAWGTRSGLSQHQQAFLPFGLDSYVAGDLEMTIGERPLAPETDREQVEALLLEMQIGLSRKEALRRRGYSEEQITAMTEENREASEAMGRGLLGAFDRGQA